MVSSSRSRTAQRRVRFAMGSGTEANGDFSLQVTQLGPQLPHFSEISSDERKKLWWSHEDLAELKSAAHAEACDIRSRASSAKNLDDPTSYSRVIQRLYLDCMVMNYPSPNTIGQLEQWSISSHSGRGLERISVPLMAREEECSGVVSHVLKVQALAEKHKFTDNEERARFKPLLIQQASLEYSRTSQVLARAFAAADAFAALGERQQQDKIVPSFPGKRTQLQRRKSMEGPHHSKLIKINLARVPRQQQASSE